MLFFASKTFEELTTEELYQILALRAEVFVVEQDCPYQDLDGKDKEAVHLMGYFENKLAAYARILPKGISYKQYASIGRIVTHQTVRGKNYGHQLVDQALSICKKIAPKDEIKISAQAQLEKFYNAHGFAATGEAYLEDNIPHIGMLHKTEA